MSNQQIAELFRNVAAAYSIKDERKYYFQIIAYHRAADAIDNSTTEIKDLFDQKSLQSLPGVGTSIKSHIEELLKTGKVSRFKWVFENIPEAVFPLLKIPSFGPKRAYKLVKTFGLGNPESVVDDLEKIAKENKISPLAGFGEKSQNDILRAIKEYKEGKSKQRRMTLPFAAELAKKITDFLIEDPNVLQVSALGSLRRMVSTIGDIDIAVASNNSEKVINHFVSYPYKERIIEKGNSSASILISGGYQVDLMVQPVKSFGSLLQHFTGSKDHNIHLRELAIKKGLSLSEKGIKKIKDPKAGLATYSTEKDFYNALGLDLIPPEMRENTGEIELAAKHKLPRLIELSDIKGDLHLHSNFSIEPSHDLGQSSMQDMLNKAVKLKYEYLGFSEHNPSVSKHNDNQCYEILKKRDEKIEQIKSNIKSVRIIKLLEVDILASGELSLSEKSLALLDGAIVSIHSAFNLNKEQMTERVLNGLSNPKAKILAHPTGRLINERQGYDLDWEKIFEFCQKHNKALEINSWPNRLDLPDNIVRRAVTSGIKLVINTDSHAAYQMGLMEYGVSVARRGWAKKSDIINTLSYNEFMKWLKN
ncbi:MAG: DNA polymerase III [Candidatus Levybacteria bacterium CG_4_9_14_3_um_filter_35_16]|nr:MAG: DNA polymerase III [Candidatus Levybacteria bacterium CG22_combo_CG10-13_8_21_14_all_35_11]PJA91191.1 MAG: DNA polymerase III [Candidatus Levybacteria bacterium CG_4_9_14_3_um_filter_35_16]PJC54876.1 MAG: DNA polymerase III [Candidatus Levybacteria bacterium CG_4_9_14_0_2_um_filter_35_21]